MKLFSQQFMNDYSTAVVRKNILSIALLIAIGSTSQVYAYTTIDSQLDEGETNRDVTSLQTFFKDKSQIYPSGLVTGYFGSLTKASVMKFQQLYGFDQVGRVGPVTRDKINSLITSGGWNGVTQSGDVSGPAFSSIYQSQTNTSASISFATNEITSARVVYYTSPLMFNEGDITSAGFGPIGGFSAYSSNGSAQNHSVSVTNLQPNTIYYYTIIATDMNGNVSVWGPNMTLRTNTQ